MKTAEMALVMALGILMHGVLPYYLGAAFNESVLSNIFVTIVLAIWINFIFSILTSCHSGKFKELHLSDPMNLFGIGTWVAASSICGVLIVNHFPQLDFLPKIILFLNILLWLYFICHSIQAFLKICQNQMLLLKSSHGIFLLTTVSTQSIVVFLHYVFHGTPGFLLMTMMGIGLLFYLISAFLILKRYMTIPWSVERDWKNTNCILHGALSISGLAAILSDVVNDQLILFFWIFTIFIFLIIESIEIFRIYRRIDSYGLKKGIFIYDVSQWSRVFTFAMFYTFTSYIHCSETLLTMIQSAVLQFGIWVIVFLILFEVLLIVEEHRKTIRMDR